MSNKHPAIRQLQTGRWQAGFGQCATVTTWKLGTYRWAWQALIAARRECRDE